MLYLILGLLVIASIALVLLVLAQNPKGGGLSGTFGGAAQQFLGARQGADLVEKLTWYFGAGIFVLVFAVYFKINGGPANAGVSKAKVSEGINYDLGNKKTPQGAPQQQNAVPQQAVPTGGEAKPVDPMEHKEDPNKGKSDGPDVTTPEKKK